LRLHGIVAHVFRITAAFERSAQFRNHRRATRAQRSEIPRPAAGGQIRDEERRVAEQIAHAAHMGRCDTRRRFDEAGMSGRRGQHVHERSTA
jgi:hypothetical protein